MIPKHHELFSDVLYALADGATLSVIEIVELVANRRELSPDVRNATLPKGGNKFKNRIEWAKTYLKAAGLIEYPKRGKSKITSAGLIAINDKEAIIDMAYLMQFESFRRFTNKESNPNSKAYNEAQALSDDTQSATPQEQMDRAFSEINTVLRGEILDEIMARSPRFFESLVVKLLVKMGYGGLLDGEGIVTQYTNDEGIDGIIREDKLGFSNIYIQAKRYALDKSIGRSDVQGFVGAVATKEGKRLFITTATFANTAKQYAKENHVVLVDGDKLAELMIEYGVGVSTIQTYEIKRLDSDFFEEQ